MGLDRRSVFPGPWALDLVLARIQDGNAQMGDAVISPGNNRLDVPFPVRYHCQSPDMKCLAMSTRDVCLGVKCGSS